MSKPNKFAVALDDTETPQDDAPTAVADPSPQTPVVTAKAPYKPSRANTKHVGGHYRPTVSKQLNQIALDEDRTVQDVLAEAIDMLFQSRQMPPIASQPKQEA